MYTPKHGSWLNMAEIELNVLTGQCLNRRIDNIEIVRKEAAAKKKDGPDGKLRKIFEDASRLPRRQQDKIAKFLSAFINQYRQSHSQ